MPRLSPWKDETLTFASQLFVLLSIMDGVGSMEKEFPLSRSYIITAIIKSWRARRLIRSDKVFETSLLLSQYSTDELVTTLVVSHLSRIENMSHYTPASPCDN